MKQANYEVVLTLDKEKHPVVGPICYYLFNTLLFCLLVLHIYWWVLMYRMLVNQIQAGGKISEDVRSGRRKAQNQRKKWESKTKDSEPAVPLPQETETETKTEEPEPPPLEDATPAEAEKELKQHTYFVALATAMAAAAAVAASKATNEAVRVASLQRISLERTAATKIQTAFRGYLARRALPELRRSERLKSMIEAIRERARENCIKMHAKSGSPAFVE
ncbi:hypothetical protein J1N35_022225 [Gossypium stocksii]|uniref:TLC domain-containing protein n=1 Tax=Gossypium stocksii TaxID=47602 RepID=A0A9D4A388_9ROSI|nr:hypothetical protein J1N35_022225 [Gossypium stocksii]